MPTYDYFCAQCTHEFEAFHGMNDVLTTCPECGHDALRRKIGTGAGLIFKGSGFYQTDYKPSGGGSSTASKAESGSSSPESATASSGASTTASSGD